MNTRCMQFMNVGFKKKIRKAHIPQIKEIPQQEKKCVKYASYHTYSATLVHERTIPTEQPPLVGEVSANFCG
jgi:hypothetical protein